MKRLFATLLTGLLAAALLFCGCASATAETIEVAGEQIPSLYAVIGEKRTITGTSVEASTAGSQSSITYGKSDVLLSDVLRYIAHLHLEQDYYITQANTATGNTHTLQLGKAATKDGKIILIDISYLVASGSDESAPEATFITLAITYTVCTGTITPADTAA